ncbi:MAG: hypothetical protein IJ841_03045 [Prevotella sp.]|nr:hypothetical protein [Prevotella sp.]
MAKYLDPKADLTFKKIFGEHPNLVMSLLNALLPLPKGGAGTDIHSRPGRQHRFRHHWHDNCTDRQRGNVSMRTTWQNREISITAFLM